MALLDWITPGDSLRLQGEGIEIRPPRPSDYPEWSELRRASRAFLQPWEPTWPDDDLTRGAWRRRLASYARDIDLGAAYPFLVFRKSDGALTGGITLSNVRRGVAQMGTVGYWCGVGFTRQGHTLAAVRTLSLFAFRTLALHRLEAACLPGNTPSRRLLGQAGFREEGLAQAYLKINGEWRDHVLFGRVAPSPRDESSQAPLSV
ncbi:MAG: GNAT family N-acetyltransferase [Phenylobacterium sp.]|uniref:GNAT family N-acetyltransferase n=1 Tax=Phenylobacterium sp. TaxID=1871053 RepID=UPI0025FAAC47|nr:GNAT family protein [Phenylobacterium sp.]MCA6223942.1 GNAT family N-acetyltransferase [Phenylobacterium sp.]MCA6227542.1 GNAT family N-acetyltransferase [Phenylobacterium sp.]MCA6231159.1 GNAT family N-acetyltransferase [Phenylobacterium sp.]MCA6234134.1 GNAT family N-acetyltransferase [Phenylobacterium sp.]MCA6248361.1 GNAT family N-acetyltransferase [Phenylobacterium sp.]